MLRRYTRFICLYFFRIKTFQICEWDISTEYINRRTGLRNYRWIPLLKLLFAHIWIVRNISIYFPPCYYFSQNSILSCFLNAYLSLQDRLHYRERGRVL